MRNWNVRHTEIAGGEEAFSSGAWPLLSCQYYCQQPSLNSLDPKANTDTDRQMAMEIEDQLKRGRGQQECGESKKG